MSRPEVRLLVPHAASVGVYEGEGFMTFSPHDVERPARARTEAEDVGSVCINGCNIAMQAVTILPDVRDLPDPQPDVYNIVSKMTALAAGPERDDLLYLYGDIRTKDAFLGVKGLGRPVFQRRLIEGQTAQFVNPSGELRNTAGYPMKIFPEDSFTALPGKMEPRVVLAPCERPTQLRYDDGGVLDHELSRELGVAVYDQPRVIGVDNVDAKVGDGTLRLANPNVALTLGWAGIERGFVSLVNEVRDEDPHSSRYKSILGGRALGIYVPHQYFI